MLEQRQLLDFPIIGLARAAMPTEQLVKRAREAITDSGEQLDEAVFDRCGRGRGALPRWARRVLAPYMGGFAGIAADMPVNWYFTGRGLPAGHDACS
jgi:hypothetical protein